jgi:hypothetical protein
MTRSMRPSFRASAALMGLPDTHISTAAAIPTSRGTSVLRAGMMPRLTPVGPSARPALQRDSARHGQLHAAFECRAVQCHHTGGERLDPIQ